MEDRKRVLAANRLLMAEVLTTIAGSFLLGIYIAVGGTYTTLTLLIFSSMLVAFPVIVFIVGKGSTIKEYILFHRAKIVSIPLVMMIMLLLYPAVGFINAISMFFTPNALSETLNESTAQEYGVFLMLLIVAVLPAIFEELIFRGVAYGAYRKKSMIKGAVLSAFCFGVFHGNLNQFLYAFFLGIALTFLLEGTGNMLAPMIGHFTLNASSVLLLYLPDSTTENVAEAALESSAAVSLGMQTAVLGVMTAITLPLAAILFFLLCRVNGRWDHVKGIFIKKRHPNEGRQPSVHNSINHPSDRQLQYQQESYRLNGQVFNKSNHQEPFAANNRELDPPAYTGQAMSARSEQMDQYYQSSQIQPQTGPEEYPPAPGPNSSYENASQRSQKRKMNSLVSASLIVFIVICGLEIFAAQFIAVMEGYLASMGF